MVRHADTEMIVVKEEVSIILTTPYKREAWLPCEVTRESTRAR